MRHARVEKNKYRVKLTCGHEIAARNNPLTDTTKFGCTHGQGCGYFLHWVSWRHIENDQTGANKIHKLTTKEA